MHILTPPERRVLTSLETGQRSYLELCEDLKEPAASISSALSQLRRRELITLRTTSGALGRYEITTLGAAELSQLPLLPDA